MECPSSISFTYVDGSLQLWKHNLIHNHFLSLPESELSTTPKKAKNAFSEYPLKRADLQVESPHGASICDELCPSTLRALFSQQKK